MQLLGVVAEDPTVKHKGTRNALLDFKNIFLLKKKILLYKRSYSTCSRNRISPINFHFTKLKYFGEIKFHLIISTNRPYKDNSTKSRQNYSTELNSKITSAKLTYGKYF